MTSEKEALELFDSLEPVDIDFMLGRWRGEGYPTGHPTDGALEALAWYGKEFVSAEHVHPLLFTDSKGKIVKLNPGRMEMGGDDEGSVSDLAIKAFKLLMPIFVTTKSQARLRMMEYRGKVSATMIYDQLPVYDIFRKIDDDTVLGVMDKKLGSQPFFFKLTRDTDA